MSAWPAPPTLGLEEELHLLDATTLVPASRAQQVLARLPGRPELMGELTLTQVELATDVCTTLAQVREQVLERRGALLGAARAEGCALASCGTSPTGTWRTAEVNPDPDYVALRERGGRLVSEQLIAGVHVHVGVNSPDLGAAALTRIRPWLPVLLALSASSPWWEGGDTGFASWRWVHWRRWPVSGLPPAVADGADWEATVQQLGALGLATPRQLYWDARLSSRFPTLEVRVADALPTAAATVAFAGVVRALVTTALADERSGRPRPATSDLVLDAAGWRAARWGLVGELVDPLGDALVPAKQAVASLVAHLTPALEHLGDGDVHDEVQRWAASGGPAAEMRAAGDAVAAARWVVAQTAVGVTAAPVVRAAAATAHDPDETRLRAEVPPHHG